MAEAVVEEVAQAIVALDRQRTVQAAEKALAVGSDPTAIINDGLCKGLLTIGDMWRRKERFISHVLVAAAAMKDGLNVVEPHLQQAGQQKLGTVVLGTVKGDMHDIGKNLVGAMLRAAGFEVHDLGVDVSPSAFIEKAGEVKADVIALSLLMTVCLDSMREVTSLLKASALAGRVKTMVGGPQLSERVAATIGADMYGGPDAVAATESAKRLMAMSVEA